MRFTLALSALFVALAAAAPAPEPVSGNILRDGLEQNTGRIKRADCVNQAVSLFSRTLVILYAHANFPIELQ